LRRRAAVPRLPQRPEPAVRLVLGSSPPCG
jgi:hypothetical protein